VNNKKWRKRCKFVLLSYLVTHGLPVLTMGTKCSNQVFCAWFVDLQTICVNRGWKFDSLRMMIFVHVCLTCIVVEPKTRLETWNARNVLNGLYWFHLSYLITVLAYLCSQWTPIVQIKYFMFDWSIYRTFVLNMGRKRALSKWWYSYTSMFTRHAAQLN
jgi:hypothetical protein